MIRYLGIIFLLSLTINRHSEDCRIKVLGYSSLLGKGSLGNGFRRSGIKELMSAPLSL